MSVTAYAYTLVGCKFTGRQLSKVEKAPGCEHSHYYSHYGSYGKFCSECGAPRFIEKVIEPEWIDKGNLDDLDVIFQQNDLGDDHVFVGFCVGDTELGGYSFQVVVREDFKDSIRKTLEKHGLWDESKYGVWTILCF